MSRSIVLLLAMACLLGCAQGRYRRPSLLAGAGAILASGGAVTYALADRESSLALTRTGAGTLAAGLALLMAAGIWAAVRSGCESNTDCMESEYCQTLYTTAGIYGHCIAR